MATMISPLRRATQVAADRTAVVCGGARLSYTEMAERCERLAGALRGLGVGAGGRVAIVSPNCHRYLEVYQAVPGGGMVLVPLNQRHTDAELRYALEDSGTRVLFAGRPVGALAAYVEHVIDLDDGYEALLAAASPDDLAPVHENALAGLFYTGGTTGAAKGVMLSHRNLVANAFHLLASLPLGPDTAWLIAAPLFHA